MLFQITCGSFCTLLSLENYTCDESALGEEKIFVLFECIQFTRGNVALNRLVFYCFVYVVENVLKNVEGRRLTNKFNQYVRERNVYLY